jgi:hypothetical protein
MSEWSGSPADSTSQALQQPKRRCLALELFSMAEEVIGQLPPLRAGGSGVARHHELVVEIECDDAQGSREAQDRLERWISTLPPATGSPSSKSPWI